VRVFVAVRHANDPREHYGGLWSMNFYPALRALGCELVESQVDLQPASRFMHIAGDFTREELQCRASLTERILAEVRAAHADRPIGLFLSYFYNSHFAPEGFSELRRLGIPTVTFFCNSLYQFELVRDIARAADFAWHAEKPARDLYVAAGARPVWVQMAADPNLYIPVPGAVREPVACFIGQRCADRDRWAATLLRAQVPLRLYGSGWSTPPPPSADADAASAAHVEARYLGRVSPRPGTRAAYFAAIRQNWRANGLWSGSARTWRQLHYRRESRKLHSLLAAHARGPLTFDQQEQVVSECELILNFSNVWADGRPGSVLIPHVRLRDFEAPMRRACYLTGHTEEITEFYEVGKEIDTYRTPEELVDKCRFYLAHPDAAERLREAGFRRARLDHTWERRFETLFAQTGLRVGR